MIEQVEIKKIKKEKSNLIKAIKLVLSGEMPNLVSTGEGEYKYHKFFFSLPKKDYDIIMKIYLKIV